jgi:hypothetical protein
VPGWVLRAESVRGGVEAKKQALDGLKESVVKIARDVFSF